MGQAVKVKLVDNVEEFRLYPEVKKKTMKSVNQKKDMFGFPFETYSDQSVEKKLEGDRIGGRERNMISVTLPQEKENKHLNQGGVGEDIDKQTHFNVRSQNDHNIFKVDGEVKNEREVKDAYWMPTDLRTYSDDGIIHYVLCTEYLRSPKST